MGIAVLTLLCVIIVLGWLALHHWISNLEKRVTQLERKQGQSPHTIRTTLHGAETDD